MNTPIVLRGGAGLLALGLFGALALAAGALAQSPPVLPGGPPPAEVERELRAAIALAIHRFEAKDLEGLLALVSDEYRTGYLTKGTLRAQLLGMFQLYETLKTNVRVEEIRLVGEHAWVVSSGEVLGRLPLLGRWMTVLAWERELEVARREAGGWRLYGYQQ